MFALFKSVLSWGSVPRGGGGGGWLWMKSIPALSFEIVNRHSSRELFDGVGTLVQKDSKVDLFMPQ